MEDKIKELEKIAKQLRKLSIKFDEKWEDMQLSFIELNRRKTRQEDERCFDLISDIEYAVRILDEF